ncbi:uncharacterized protein C8R40DRAFT_1171848 [Lentinula edodes]|uniref:uncharacterized protein n=1 Tax=Lentinula edodes TaxID=5353 RepID=UPI001E8E2943|nr:uncharacterized protein C8R40DRAFT_1171848 [Lentinula edodes]KAH7873929.1 hypothetical protein C8R40DRAFT_1171848 [Lentinula edodes]
MSFNFGSTADFEPRPSDASPISTPRMGSYPNFLRNIDNPVGVGMGATSRPQRDRIAANRPYTPSARPPLQSAHGTSSFPVPTNGQDVRHLGVSPDGHDDCPPSPINRSSYFSDSGHANSTSNEDMDELDEFDSYLPQPVANGYQELTVPIFNSSMRKTPRSNNETAVLMTWVDEIRAQFALEPNQVREIKGMVVLARNMETEPLKLHLLTHAAICRSENKYTYNNSQSSSVKEVVDVAMNQLSKHVEIPADTKNVLRMIARDECANPTRSSYGDVGIAVWARSAKAAGNKILQQFRDDIMATIVIDESGKKETQNLEKATHALCKKYVKGGGGGTLHQFRFAVIRRFMRESECDEQGPVLKRRKTNNGGRQAQDEAFWGRFDKCLKEKIDDYGPNVKVGKWKEYFCETVQADWERFGKPSNVLLPALPITASNNGTTTVRAPLAEVPNNAHSVPRAPGDIEDGLANHDDEYTQF